MDWRWRAPESISPGCTVRDLNWSSWKRLGICYCYRALINSVSMVSCDADRSLILVMIMYTSVSHGYERGPGSRASCYLGPAAHELRHIPYH